ncbi:MAG: PEP-CTERM sorting domain-containing protein [Bryobacterales bacterium]|nr:PEP-CTERM sorting domain-containing protein [Bryobacterales bacterium]
MSFKLRFLSLWVAILCSAAPVFAGGTVVPCAGLTLDLLTVFGPNYVGECSVADKTFSSFVWASNSVSPGSVTLTALDTPAENPGLRFTGPFGPLAGEEAISMTLEYIVLVTDAAWLIKGASLSFAGANFNGGSGSITGIQDWCGEDFAPCFGGQSIQQAILLDGGGGSALYSGVFSPAVGFVHTLHTIQVEGDPAVDTAVNQFEVRFEQQGGTVPEASTSALLALGLAACGWRLRRRIS